MSETEKALARLGQWRDGTAPDVSYCAGNALFGKDVQALLAHVTQITNERDGEREARERCSDALRMKDAAMSALMNVCTQEQIERAAGGPLP